MKFNTTIHFQYRFGLRNINFDHVKQTIKNPDSKISLDGGLTKVLKKIGDEIMVVVYSMKLGREGQQICVVITVYYKGK